MSRIAIVARRPRTQGVLLALAALFGAAGTVFAVGLASHDPASAATTCSYNGTTKVATFTVGSGELLHLYQTGTSPGADLQWETDGNHTRDTGSNMCSGTQLTTSATGLAGGGVGGNLDGIVVNGQNDTSETVFLDTSTFTTQEAFGPGITAETNNNPTSTGVANGTGGVETFTLSGHPLQNTDTIEFTSVASTGLTIGTTYFVVNRASSTFQVAATSGGTPIDLGGSTGQSVTWRRVGTKNEIEVKLNLGTDANGVTTDIVKIAGSNTAADFINIGKSSGTAYLMSLNLDASGVNTTQADAAGDADVILADAVASKPDKVIITTGTDSGVDLIRSDGAPGLNPLTAADASAAIGAVPTSALNADPTLDTVVFLGDGGDAAALGGGADIIDGGNGTDNGLTTGLQGGTGDDIIRGGDSNDSGSAGMFGGDGDDVYWGGCGDDNYKPSNGDDIYFEGYVSGYDGTCMATAASSNGNDLIGAQGDPGFNIVAYPGRTAALTIITDGRNADNTNNGAADGTASGATGAAEADRIQDNIAGIVGGTGGDTITPGSASTALADSAVWPGKGDDTVTFDATGVDVLAYNQITVPDGFSTCPSFTSCTFDGDKDLLQSGDYGAGLTINATCQNATGTYCGTQNRHELDTNGSTAGNDIATGYEQIIGSELGDTIIAPANVGVAMRGAGGNDTITSSATSAGHTATLGVTGTGSSAVAAQGVFAATLVSGGSASTDTTTIGNKTAGFLGQSYGYGITGGEGIDTITGGAGNDLIGGLNGNDTITGGDGNDTIDGNEGADIIDGGNGADTIAGGGGTDSILGGAGNDTISGGATSSNERQRFRLSAAATPVTGGTFTLSYNGNATSALPYNADTRTVRAALAALTGIGSTSNVTVTEGPLPTATMSITFQGTLAATNVSQLVVDGTNLTGGTTATTLTTSHDGTTGSDVIDAGSGDDTVYGGANPTANGDGDGNDVINGGIGLDTIEGGDGIDSITGGADRDTMTGSNGNDRFIQGASSDDADSVRGSAGTTDKIIYGASEIQAITPATSGNTTVTYNGNSTSALALTATEASASTLQTALQALTGIGSGNVMVRAGVGADLGKLIVEFTGDLDATDVSALSVSGTGASVAQVTTGAARSGNTNVMREGRYVLDGIGNPGLCTVVAGTCPTAGAWNASTARGNDGEATEYDDVWSDVELPSAVVNLTAFDLERTDAASADPLHANNGADGRDIYVSWKATIATPQNQAMFLYILPDGTPLNTSTQNPIYRGHFDPPLSTELSDPVLPYRQYPRTDNQVGCKGTNTQAGNDTKGNALSTRCGYKGAVRDSAGNLFNQVAGAHTYNAYVVTELNGGSLISSSVSFDMYPEGTRSTTAAGLEFSTHPTDAATGANVTGTANTPTDPAVDVVVVDSNGNPIVVDPNGSANETITLTLNKGAIVTGATAENTGDLIRKAGHGLTNGTQIELTAIGSGATGYTTYAPYWVVGATTDTFQLSATEAGSAVVISADGSGISYTVPATPFAGLDVTAGDGFLDPTVVTNSTTMTARVDWLTGRAVFDSFNIDQTWNGYGLVATFDDDDALATLLVGASAKSQTFDVAAGAPATMEWSVQPPLNTAADARIGGLSGVTVRLLDSNGNLAAEPSASLTETITVCLTKGTTTGATATAADDRITRSGHALANGTKIRLTALTGAAGLATATDYFVINRDATSFQLSLSSGGAVIDITTDGSGIAYDLNNLDTTNAGNENVHCVTANVDWSTSSATFTNLNIDEVQTAYQFIAQFDTDSGTALQQNGGVSDASSNLFNIVNAVNVLAWLQQPTNTISDQEINNTADTVGPISITAGSSDLVVRLEDGTGSAAAEPSGTVNEAIVLTLTKTGMTGATATASDDTITSSGHGLVNGDQVQITAATGATGITLTTQTYFVVNKTTNTFQVALTSNGAAVDITTDGTAIAYRQLHTKLDTSLPSNPGQNVTTVSADIVWPAGTATFSNLNIDERATYTLIARYDDDSAITGLQNTTGVVDVDSNPFDILGAAPASLVWRVQPTNTVAGVEIDATADTVGPLTTNAGGDLVVAVLDAFGNDAADPTAYTETITATLPSAVAVTNASAQATGDTITKSSHGLSNLDQVLLVSTDSTTGLDAGVIYYVRNVTTNTFQVSLTSGGAIVDLTSNSAGTALSYRRLHALLDTSNGGDENASSATATVAWTTTSTATFADLNIDQRATGYIFNAGLDTAATTGQQPAGVSDAESNAFNILGAAPASMVWTVQPTHTIADSEIDDTVDTVGPIAVNGGADLVVTVLDIFGNPAGDPTADSENITATLFGPTITGATAADLGNVITKVGHGLANATRVELTSLGTATGVDTVTRYYVVGATADTFQLSLTNGGAAVNITADGTISYRQVFARLDTSLPSFPGQNLSATSGDVVWTGASPSTVTYSNLNIDERFVGYVFVASYDSDPNTTDQQAAGVANVDSNAFDILGAAPASIVWTVQPSHSIAGVEIDEDADSVGPLTIDAGEEDLTVSVLDAFGNQAGDPTAAAETITATLPNGTISGASAQNAGDTITKTAHGLTNGTQIQLTATDSAAGLDLGRTYFVVGATANTFQVSLTSGGAAVAITSDSAATAVALRLLHAKIDTTFAAGAGENTSSQSTAVDWSGTTSKVVYTNLNIDERATGYIFNAAYDNDPVTAGQQATSVADVASNAFNILGAAPATIAWTVQPSHTVADNEIDDTADTVGPITVNGGADLVVSVLDFFGNHAGDLTAATETISGTLTGPTTTGAAAAASGDTITKAAHGLANDTRVQLTSVGTATGVDTTNTYFVVGATTNTFQLSLSSGGAAVNITADGTVAYRVIYARLDTTLPSFPGGNAMSASGDVVWGTTSRVTYSNLNIDERFTGYQLIAALDTDPVTTGQQAAGVANVDSNAFNILGAAPATMTWRLQPSHTIANSEIDDTADTTGPPLAVNAGNDLVVAVLDAFGNDAGDPTAASESIAATLTGPTVTGASAQATGDTITKTAHGLANGTQLQLTSLDSATGVSTATTYYVVSASTNTFKLSTTSGGSAIDITANSAGSSVAYRLIYTRLDTTALGDQNATGTSGNVVWSTTSTVTYANLNIDTTMTGYVLIAAYDVDPVTTGQQAAGVANVDSNAFNILHAAMDHLRVGPIADTPSDVTIDGPDVDEVTVTVVDIYDNPVTTDPDAPAPGDQDTITITLSCDAAPTGAIDGTTTSNIDWSTGEATYVINIDEAQDDYCIIGTTGGFGPTITGTSNFFDITAGPAAKLKWVTQWAAEPITPDVAFDKGELLTPISIGLYDAQDNQVKTPGVSISISLMHDGGAATTLVDNAPVLTNSNGVADFSSLVKINDVDVDYTLVGTSTGLTPTPEGNQFDIVQTSTKLVIVDQPPDDSPYNPFEEIDHPTCITVEVQDDDGNRMTDDNTTIVTLQFVNNASGSAALANATVTVVAGRAIFCDLNIDDPGEDYTVRGIDGSPTPRLTPTATSHRLDIVEPPEDNHLPSVTIRIQVQEPGESTWSDAVAGVTPKTKAKLRAQILTFNDDDAADLPNLVYVYEWWVNGVRTVTTGPTTTLTDIYDLKPKGRGDLANFVTVVVKPHDGHEFGPSAQKTVQVANTPPTATAKSVSVSASGSTTFGLAGTDPDNQTLKYRVTSLPSHGTLTFGGAPITAVPYEMADFGNQLTYTNAGDTTDSFAFDAGDVQGTTTSWSATSATVSIGVVETGTPTVDIPVGTGTGTTPGASPLGGGTLTVGANGSGGGGYRQVTYEPTSAPTESAPIKTEVQIGGTNASNFRLVIEPDEATSWPGTDLDDPDGLADSGYELLDMEQEVTAQIDPAGGTAWVPLDATTHNNGNPFQITFTVGQSLVPVLADDPDDPDDDDLDEDLVAAILVFRNGFQIPACSAGPVIPGGQTACVVSKARNTDDDVAIVVLTNAFSGWNFAAPFAAVTTIFSGEEGATNAGSLNNPNGGHIEFAFRSVPDSDAFNCELTRDGDTVDIVSPADDCFDASTYNPSDVVAGIGRFKFDVSTYPDDLYTFRVQSEDGGNIARRDFVIDRTAPSVTITDGPTGITASSTAAFDFESNEPGADFACSLDGGSFVDCDSGDKTYTGLANGVHTFLVRATDSVGNSDTETQDFTVRVTSGGGGGTTRTTLSPPTNTPLRVAGRDRAETAQLVSRLAFPNGADVVYIATEWDYADALSAGPGAVSETAPVLLTAIHSLNPNTAIELERLKPRRIVVMGGYAAVDDAVFEQLRPYASEEIVRIAGVDRFGTAAMLSADKFPDGAETVYVATGRSYPDALAGGLAASEEESPILLTEPNVLPDVTATELLRLHASRIVVVGGTGAVARGLEALLADYAPVVERVAGVDRYETTAEIDARVVEGTDTVFIVTGKTFGDALTGIPLAALTDSAVLMVGDGILHASVIAELDRLQPKNVIVLGGTAAVAERVEQQLASHMGDGTGGGTRGLQISQSDIDDASASMREAQAASHTATIG